MILKIIILWSILLFTTSCQTGLGERTHVLKSTNQNEITLMDFSKPFDITNVDTGWYHKEFFWHDPMKIEFTTFAQKKVLKISTKDSASMLIRHVDIDLSAYPRLDWGWYIEKPIDPLFDEKTHEGDDHPARLFIQFLTKSGVKRSMEIIWGNRLKEGDYKYIGDFPHYVARGEDKNTKKWFNESINLLKIYEKIWPDKEPASIQEIAIFCDSDQMDGESVSYFSNVVAKK